VHQNLDVFAGLAGPGEGNGGHGGILQAVVTMKTGAIQERLTHPLALFHVCLPMKCFVDQPSASPKFKRSRPYDVNGECASPLCASATSPKKTNVARCASIHEAAFGGTSGNGFPPAGPPKRSFLVSQRHPRPSPGARMGLFFTVSTPLSY
jgi:hypothetical protein